MASLDNHSAYQWYQKDWQLLRDFYKGERWVKYAGKTYLPQLEDQNASEYENYKSRTVFLNAVKRTVQGLVGVAFRRPVEWTLGEGNEDLEADLETFTNDGLSFGVFAREVFRETILMGRCGVLVDAPPSGGLPYVTVYAAENITDWKVATKDGRKSIEKICVYEEDGNSAIRQTFGHQVSDQYRLLSLESGDYTQTVYMVNDKGDYGGPAQEFTPQVGGQSIQTIPFTFFGPNNCLADVDQSPVVDIARLNEKHYLASADLSHALHYSALPTPYVTGFSGDAGALSLGPNRVWLLDTDQKAGMLEFKGEGLSYLEGSVSRLKEEMSLMGAGLMAEARRGSENSEVVQTRARGEQATLLTVLDTVERGLENVLQLYLLWRNRDPRGVQVRLNRDLSETQLAYRDVLMIMRLYMNGLMPMDAVLDKLYEGDILPSNMTASDAKELLGMDDQRPPEDPKRKVL